VTDDCPRRIEKLTCTATDLSAFWLIDEFYSMFLNWELSKGSGSSLSALEKANLLEQGKFSRHGCTAAL
jgi:hypothetical protein